VSAGADRLPLEAAADWFVVLSEDASAETRARWQRWHDAAPAHGEAWQKVEKLQSLLAAAPRQAGRILHKPETRTRRQLLALLGVALASGLGWRWMSREQAATPVWIASAAGQRRDVALPDGGRVWLAPATRIGIAWSGGARDLILSQGALQLTSGHDSSGRPLRILARDGVVRPLGTRLTLSQYAARSTLAVQEHAAEVQPLHGALQRVDAGQRVSFTSAGAGRPQAASSAEDGWTRGLLTALDLPLAEFAEQFALYSGLQIAVAPALAGLRVSGAYRIDAPERSLHTLAEVLAIRAERSAQGWRLRPR
jgi:transmembrane sensor